MTFIIIRLPPICIFVETFFHISHWLAMCYDLTLTTSCPATPILSPVVRAIVRIAKKEFRQTTPLSVSLLKFLVFKPYTALFLIHFRQKNYTLHMKGQHHWFHALFLRILFQFQHVLIKVGHKQPVLNDTILFKFSLSFCLGNLCRDLSCILKDLSVISHQE